MLRRKFSLICLLVCLLLPEIVLIPMASAEKPVTLEAGPETLALLEQGQKAEDSADTEAALRHYRAAQETARRERDGVGEAQAEDRLGLLLAYIGEPKKGRDLLNRALARQQSVGDRPGEAWTRTHLAQAAFLMGRTQEALTHLEAAKRLFNAQNDRRGLAWAQTVSGFVHVDLLGQLNPALALLNEALTLHQETGDRRGEAWTRTYIGLAYMYAGDPQKALPALEQALPLHRMVGDKRGEAWNLTVTATVGVLYPGQGTRAQELMTKALAGHRAIRFRWGEAWTHCVSGIQAQNTGHTRQALTRYEQALSVFRTIQDLRGTSALLSNIAGVYYLLGQTRTALSCWEEALPMLRTVGNRLFAANALNNIGLAYCRYGETEKGLKYFLETLALRRELGDRAGEAVSLLNIGATYNDLDKSQQALPYLEQALSLAQQLGARREEAAILFSLGCAQAASKHPSQAQGYLQQALAMYRETGDRAKEASALAEIAHQEARAGHPDAADRHYRMALAQLESLREALGSLSEAQSTYLNTNLYAYHRYIAFLLKRGDTAAAFAWTQKTKGRALLDILASGRVAVEGQMNAAERQEEQTLRRKADELNKAMIREGVRNEAGSKQRFATLKTQLQQAESALTQFTSRLYARKPELARKRAAKTVTLSDMPAFLPADTALLEYVTLKAGAGPTGLDETWLFVVTTRSGQAHLTVTALPVTTAVLSGKAEAFHAACADPRNPYRKTAQELYHLLIAPAEKQLRGKTRLIICPDGALWDVPFQALLSPHPNPLLMKERGKGEIRPTEGLRGFLAERFEIVRAYSATGAQAVWLATTQPKRAESKGNLLVLANPAFGDEKRFGDNPAILGQRPLETPSRPLETPSRPLEAPTRDLFLRRGGRLAALPGTQREADWLKRNVPGAAVYTQKRAQESVLKKAGAKYRCLHLASHAFINDAAPLLSAILLAEPPQGSGEDGFLTARELFGMDLKAALAVLSACNTARGEKRRGEGLIGLTWALFVAGVPTQCLSQWSVDDNVTAELMTRFYANLKAGQPKAMALRNATLSLFRPLSRQMGRANPDSRTHHPKWAHPYYWAPFILIGKGD